MIDVYQFRVEIVRRALLNLGKHSDAAENLVLGTAIQESGLRYLTQLDDGPALGLFQMEPATHRDIWENYLAYRPSEADLMRSIAGGEPKPERMIWDMRYAAAMCRMHYWRVSDPLPPANAIASLGEYWKRFYNSSLGHGTAKQFADNYQAFVLDRSV